MSVGYTVDLCLRIKEVRKALRMSRQKFAEKLSVSISHLSNIENGKRSVTIDFVYALYQLYNVSADYVLFGKGGMFLDKSETPGDIYTMSDAQKMSQMLQIYEYFVNYKSVLIDDHEVEIYEYVHEMDKNLRLLYYNQLKNKMKIADKH